MEKILTEMKNEEIVDNKINIIKWWMINLLSYQLKDCKAKTTLQKKCEEESLKTTR